MKIESELCFADSTRIILKLSVWDGDISLGSFISEGSTVDSAEEQCLKKIKLRLNINLDKAQTTVNTSIDDRNFIDNNNRNNILNDKYINKTDVTNNDWSKELSLIDIEIKRLEWSKYQENKYLNNLLGINNRNKITIFEHLNIYLEHIRNIKKGDEFPLKNRSFKCLIIKSSNQMLKLGWDNQRGSEFLRLNYNCSTRKELTIEQLFEFSNLLDKELKAK